MYIHLLWSIECSNLVKITWLGDLFTSVFKFLKEQERNNAFCLGVRIEKMNIKYKILLEVNPTVFNNSRKYTVSLFSGNGVLCVSTVWGSWGDRNRIGACTSSPWESRESPSRDFDAALTKTSLTCPYPSFCIFLAPASKGYQGWKDREKLILFPPTLHFLGILPPLKHP